jgi:hypothetical protein
LFLPKNEPFTTGLRLSAQPVVSQDRRFVCVNLTASLTSLDGPVTLTPITIQLSSTKDAKDPAKSFQMYLQQPKIRTLAVERTVKIPVGQTLVLNCGKRPQVAVDQGTPVYKPVSGVHIPHLDWQLSSAEMENVLLMVTPRIVVPPPKGDVVPNPMPLRPH